MDTKFNPSVWEVLEEELAYSNYRKILKRKYLVKGREASFDIMDGPNVATILPITTNNEVVLIEQFRPGPSRVQLELPGGVVERGEDPRIGAHRELGEETGYQGELTLVSSEPIDGYHTGTRYYFVAQQCQIAKDAHFSLDATEEIAVKLMGLDEFRVVLGQGRLANALGGYLGLDFLKLL